MNRILSRKPVSDERLISTELRHWYTIRSPVSLSPFHSYLSAIYDEKGQVYAFLHVCRLLNLLCMSINTFKLWKLLLIGYHRPTLQLDILFWDTCMWELCSYCNSLYPVHYSRLFFHACKQRDPEHSPLSRPFPIFSVVERRTLCILSCLASKASMEDYFISRKRSRYVTTGEQLGSAQPRYYINKLELYTFYVRY